MPSMKRTVLALIGLIIGVWLAIPSEYDLTIMLLTTILPIMPRSAISYNLVILYIGGFRIFGAGVAGGSFFYLIRKLFKYIRGRAVA